jgi:signal transduction histidine kinase/integral membrane sensor domain MASE1
LASTTTKNALLVFFAYLAGSWLGFRLTPASGVTSLLWPPNAVLTAALLLTPPRRWWTVVLAALPAHLLAERMVGLPWPLIIVLFTTNLSEAAIGAGLLHIFSDAPSRFDRLRRTAMFCASAAIAGPFISCFFDAAAVHHFRGEPFTAVWWTRFHSNLLTQLALVPVLIALVRSGRPLGERLLRQRGEAVALMLALVGIDAIVPMEGSVFGLFPMRPQAALSLIVPILLWSAIRFGTHGASLALLVTTSLAVVSASHGRGPITLASAENVLDFQMFLGIIGLPLLCLGALVEERRSSLHALRERLHVEAFLSRLSAAFVQLPSDQMDAAFATWLRHVSDFFELGGARLATPAMGAPSITPAEASSALMIPLVAGDKTLGELVFAPQPHTDFPWPERLVQRLRLVTQIFAGALARKVSEDALRASEVMKSAILSSLSSLVAVLDRAGRIIAVNETWSRHAQERDGSPAASYQLGAQYALDTDRSGAGEGLSLSAVLDGSCESVSVETRCAAAGGGERWYSTLVVPLRRAEGGAVVSHTEITERKRAEAEAQRSQQELAHFLRVSTMGELTTSLAHELNQPLAAILANAEAARMQLDTPRIDTEDLREILSDIMSEGQRAGDVIRGLRDLLRKGSSEVAVLDVNVLIRGIVKLLASDALIRKVSVHLDLADPPPLTTGDRIQLQQVILNLVLNAMDAAAAAYTSDRTVIVRSEIVDGSVSVSVQDSGAGVPPDLLERVFEPFFTTKSSGMGMGLAIAKSIVEAHWGTITARNSAGRGAVFTFSLPLARPEARV